MSLVRQIHALLAALAPSDFERMPPAERQRLADELRYWATVAQPKNDVPKSGVLLDLRNGAPRHE